MSYAYDFFRVIDMETTDFAPDGVPIELGMCDVSQPPLGAPLAGRKHSAVLVNPGVPIPPQSSAVHHITDEDVAGAPRFDEVVHEFIGRPADFKAYIAHNATLERHYLERFTGETPWICTWKCALHMWPEAPSHSNQALRYWLKPAGLDRDMASPPHRGGPDAYVTAYLLQTMLETATADQLIAWTNQPALLARMPFGDRKGRPWSEAEDSFLTWILDRDFDEDVMFTARHHEQLRRQAAIARAAPAASKTPPPMSGHRDVA